MSDSPADIRLLAECINNLISVQALPAIWTGTDPPRLVATMLETLVEMLQLRFAYSRVNSADVGDIESGRVIFPKREPPRSGARSANGNRSSGAPRFGSFGTRWVPGR